MRTNAIISQKYFPREYSAWANARMRCNNPNNPSYKYYGGRGIKFLFNDFADFFSSLGPRPEGMTLDRINVNGNYESNNCRWATDRQQKTNRTDNVFIDHNGKKQTLVEWSEEINIPLSTLWARLNVYKWSIEKSLSTQKLSISQVGKLGAKIRWGKN